MKSPSLTEGPSALLFWAVLAAVVVRIWIQPITSSFWLDETATAMLMQGSFSQMLARSALWITQSKYYMALVWPFAQIPGQLEVMLRLPSLLGLSVAAVAIYKIGKRVMGVEGARAATLLMAVLAGYYASDARPYALGIMVASGAVLFLLRWQQSGSWLDALAYGTLAGLTGYFHFLFAVMFGVHAIYILMRGPRWIQLAAAWGWSLVLMIPLALTFLRVMSTRRSFNFISRPRLASIVLDSFPIPFYGFLAAGLLLVVILCSDVKFSRPKSISPEAWLLVAWALLPPFALFAISYVSTSVFLYRYFSVALPGLALLTAWIIANLQPAAARTILVLALVAGAILDMGGPARRPKHQNEDWRGAMEAVNTAAAGEILPVLVRSDFIESADPGMFADTTQANFLLSPQMVYPIQGTIIPLQIHPEDGALRRLDSVVEQILEKDKKFILVTSSTDVRYQFFLKGRLGGEFIDRDLGNFGTVAVHVFERPARD